MASGYLSKQFISPDFQTSAWPSISSWKLGKEIGSHRCHFLIPCQYGFTHLRQVKHTEPTDISTYCTCLKPLILQCPVLPLRRQGAIASEWVGWRPPSRNLPMFHWQQVTAHTKEQITSGVINQAAYLRWIIEVDSRMTSQSRLLPEPRQTAERQTTTDDDPQCSPESNRVHGGDPLFRYRHLIFSLPTYMW